MPVVKRKYELHESLSFWQVTEYKFTRICVPGNFPTIIIIFFFYTPPPIFML